MPSASEKQARFMAAAAHDPVFARRAGIPQRVAKDFNRADAGTPRLARAARDRTTPANPAERRYRNMR